MGAHLFVGVRIIEQLSAAELATLLVDCQLLLNCCTGSSGCLMAADRAARLLCVWVHGRRPTMQLRTLGRLGQLLEQAAERAEAHYRECGHCPGQAGW